MSILILLAGLPGTGKSYLAEMIKQELGDFYQISQDEIKEKSFDKYGYQDLQEKKTIEDKAWGKYYELMEEGMRNKENLMSDYPFSNKQKPHLENLVIKYNYFVITIRMTADLHILFERQRERDLDSSRHLSHIVTTYQKGDILEDRSQADNLLSYDEFMKRCTTRGYDSFLLGKLFEVDATDYRKINYEDLISQLRELIESNNESFNRGSGGRFPYK